MKDVSRKTEKSAPLSESNLKSGLKQPYPCFSDKAPAVTPHCTVHIHCEAETATAFNHKHEFQKTSCLPAAVCTAGCFPVRHYKSCLGVCGV